MAVARLLFNGRGLVIFTSMFSRQIRAPHIKSNPLPIAGSEYALAGFDVSRVASSHNTLPEFGYHKDSSDGLYPIVSVRVRGGIL